MQAVGSGGWDPRLGGELLTTGVGREGPLAPEVALYLKRHMGVSAARLPSCRYIFWPERSFC